jgi:16S rRNA (cytosine967-C5)-methyltransferase
MRPGQRITLSRCADPLTPPALIAAMHTEAEIEDLVLHAWADVRRGNVNTAHALAEAFRDRPRLAHAQRATVVRGLFGMLHEARRIECALATKGGPGGETGGGIGDDARGDRARYVAWRVLAGEISPAEAGRSDLGIDCEEVARVDERIAREPEPVRRFALTHSLPDFLAVRLLAEHGSDADALCASLRAPAPLTLRVNTLKTTGEALIDRLSASGIRARKTRFSEDGLELEEHVNVFVLPEFHDGLFEVQDEASQLVAEIVAPPPRGSVMDFCAGAGGKTLAIGARMKNQGRIVALDPNGRRLKELRRRAARAGLFTVQMPPAKMSALHARCDRVLVDAPCSGLGVLRRKPDLRWRITEADLDRLPREQEAIAARALELVAPGGRLIYATCTLLADENERVVERLLARGGVEVVRVKEILGAKRASAITDATGTFLKLFPHRDNTDGFFAAVLRKKRG